MNRTQACDLSVPAPTPQFPHTTPRLCLPGNQLDEMVVQCNASTRIKSGRMAVTIEVTGDNLEQREVVTH